MAIKKSKVESPEEKKNREMVETIANNIANLSDAVVALLGGPLKKAAICKLLAASSGNSERVVSEVLRSLETMKSDWLK